MFVFISPPPIPIVNPFATISELNVFAPANVCAPVVTTPPNEALAGCKFSVVPEIVAPLAFAVDPIADIVVTPVGAEETQPDPLEVNTLPDVPGLVKPVPPLEIAMVVPLQVPVVIVPTEVKLELVTVVAKEVPVKVPALAIILELLAEVILPLASTVNEGIVVEEP